MQGMGLPVRKEEVHLCGILFWLFHKGCAQFLPFGDKPQLNLPLFSYSSFYSGTSVPLES